MASQAFSASELAAKKDQLVVAMSAAGATKEEITVFLERMYRNTMALPIADAGGSMTDAAKRRQVADDDGFSLVGGSPTKYAAGMQVTAGSQSGGAGTGMIPLPGYSYAASMQMGVPYVGSQPPQVDNVWEGDDKIPMPEGIATIEEWSKVINKMEGHKEIDIAGKSFGEILSESHKDEKVKKYLQFLRRKFRKDITVPFVPATQGPDLAAFAMRCHFDPDYDKKFGYVRELKK